MASHLFNKLYQNLVLRRGIQTTRNDKKPRAFICFSVSGYPDEALALVFDILLKT